MPCKTPALQKAYLKLWRNRHRRAYNEYMKKFMQNWRLRKTN